MKPNKIFVKPSRPGMNLRHPISGALPDTGRRWLDDSFTHRRIAEGGIVVATPDKPTDAAEAGDEAEIADAAPTTDFQGN